MLIDATTLNLPVLPLRGLVVFPKTLLHFDVGRVKSKNAINIAMREDQLVFLVTQKDAAVNEPDYDDLYSVGVVAKIIQVVKQPDDITRVVVEGQYRASVVEFLENDKCLFAKTQSLRENKQPKTARDTALIRQLKSAFEKYSHISPKMPPDILFKVALCKNGGELADFITSNIILDYQQKQFILSTTSVTERIENLIDILTQEIFILEIEHEIGDKAREKIEQSQREYLLREQKSVIEAELGEEDSVNETEV